MRYVSLVPSLSDLIYTFGDNGELVGATSFCTKPKAIQESVSLVGPPSNVDVDAVRALDADLVFGVVQENGADTLDAIDAVAPLVTYSVASVDDAYNLHRDLFSRITNEEMAGRIQGVTDEDFEYLDGLADDPIRTLFLIWRDPFVTVGRGTYPNDVLRSGGFKNVFGHREGFPEVTMNDIRRARPDLILCANDPFQFRKELRYTVDLRRAFPDAPLLVVSSSYFSKYGMELMSFPEYLLSLREGLDEGWAIEQFGWPPDGWQEYA